jgi:HD-like signal output (HDOD) protein
MAEKPTYEELEQRVRELEQELTDCKRREVEHLRKSGEEDVEASPSQPKGSIIENIISSFKRGEITLPSLPQINTKFKELTNKGANLQDIGDLLKQDVAISSKLISLANSAYYHGAVESKTLGQAIGRLGLSTTKQYVDAICNRTLYTTSNKNFVESIEKLWEHSLSCAYASEIVSKVLNLKVTGDAFTMGLLHDIGKLVVLQIVAELQEKGKLGENVDKIELIESVDTYHGKLGATLLKGWGFSKEYLLIVMYHDDLGGADPISKELLVVHFANLLVKSMGYDQAQQAEIDLENAESTRLLGLDSKMTAHIKEEVKGHMDVLKDILS